MKDIEHPELIEIWKNIDATDYENKLQKDVKLPSIKKKIDCNDNTEYWPKSIVGTLNGLHFLDITEFTADKIDNGKIVLPSLLKTNQCLRLNVGGIQGKMI